MITRKLAMAVGLAIAIMIPLVASSSARVLIQDETMDVAGLQKAVDAAATKAGVEDPSHGWGVSYLAKNWDDLDKKLTEGYNHGQIVSAYAKLNSQSNKGADEETVSAKDDDEKGTAKADKSDQEKGKSAQAKLNGHGNKDDEDDTAPSLAAVVATSTPTPTATVATATTVPTATATATTTETATAEPTRGQGNGNGNNGAKDRKP